MSELLCSLILLRCLLAFVRKQKGVLEAAHPFKLFKAHSGPAGEIFRSATDNL